MTGRPTWYVAAALAVVTAIAPAPALAYVGPGVGLTALGTITAVLTGMLALVAGFVWYPLKRLARRLRRRGDDGARGS